MPMFQDMNKEDYWVSFRDKIVFFNLAQHMLMSRCKMTEKISRIKFYT